LVHLSENRRREIKGGASGCLPRKDIGRPAGRPYNCFFRLGALTMNDPKKRLIETAVIKIDIHENKDRIIKDGEVPAGLQYGLKGYNSYKFKN
jgi:hypothetical protein